MREAAEILGGTILGCACAGVYIGMWMILLRFIDRPIKGNK